MDDKKRTQYIKETANRLRQRRIQQGFTSAAHIARALGWVESTYEAYELGMRVPPATKAIQIAEILQVTPHWLLFGEQELSEDNHPSAIKSVDRAHRSYMMVLESYDIPLRDRKAIQQMASSLYALLEAKGDNITYSDILKLTKNRERQDDQK